MKLTDAQLAKYMDHTLLKAEATQSQVEQILAEAKEYDTASVCINPYWVKLAAKELKGTDVSVCTVIGFPLGANTTATKVFETNDAIDNGATEVDMVINIGELKEHHDEAVQADIKALADAAHAKNAILKVIIETALLNDEEKVRASKLAVAAGTDFVKTSTGFSTAGAKVPDVKLMRETVGPNIGVKASGGVHSAKEAYDMIEAGASRLGVSASIKIIKDNQ
ncbi:deoxyribose-phosphate aldolase [Paucilactobacillus hokkaidonensis JCM 18461]|uniref:Deoxyribose-phosphate aldolase n=2 Tax=Paucilactobacillus hokkaidonensis TaxID=1193095 RepID=A0A0A1GZH7_9LACO|nr:deoxyribose-phosphate aldolase [Paucilactobacillus hokkaidonensis]KRO07687.1 deoxyribose-phosphate aldolase [Paucilactobacillus hokkaidonensis]BAP86408.1 deoxyribose-phosphate aldolase [Paucilactobacillus hokkaidonensis JCM 18461]